MRLVSQCPTCQSTVSETVSESSTTLTCSRCGSSREILASAIENGRPTACVLCGCSDLWRQKDFPPQLGLTIVGVGALASTIAWSFYWPEIAIGILMVFALVDLVLYAVMKDVLVCYRCAARHRRADLTDDDHPHFDLEVAERYRQETIRLEESKKRTST